MRIMLLETERGAGERAAQRLVTEGHEVLRCHDHGEPAWPCNALREDRTCPIEAGVDVVLTVRAHPHPRPTALEDGIACALRHHVPLVVTGALALSPFAPWTTAEAETKDLVAACEQAVRAPLRRHSEIALDEVRHVLETAEIDSTNASAAVFRNRDRLDVRVNPGVDVDRRITDLLGVRVAQAIRRVDHVAGVVDVSVS